MNIMLTGVAGLAGAFLMFCGDMLLYFTREEYKLDGTLEPYIGIMKQLPDWRLRLGGLLGPVAAFFYCIGYWHIYFAAQEDIKWLALITVLICSLGIIIGGAYHSQFTYFGLLGKEENRDGLKAVIKNVSFLSNISIGTLLVGVFLLLGLVLFGKTVYPLWFVLLTPAVTFFLSFLWARLPQPFRIILAGGWYNLMFVIYFAAGLLLAL